MDPKPVGLSPHRTIRGRPRTTADRHDPCARCGRNIPRLAATWPEGRLCFTCYYDLLPHLHERGIDLSSSQVYRLVTGTPERVSLQFLAACCDIFDASMDDLATSTATAAKRKAGGDANVVDLNGTACPRRARIVSDAD